MSDSPRPVKLAPRPAAFALRPPAKAAPTVRFRQSGAPLPGPRPPTAARPAVAAAPERSVLDLVLEIKNGKVNPKLLPAQDRQACGAQLSAEGLSVPEIAQFLKCSDRTIARDRRALQEAAALEHDPKLTGRIAGQLLAEAHLTIDRIRRVSRDRETPPAVKVDAEHRCYQVYSDLTQRLQSLGFLITAMQRHQAEVTHRVDAVPGYDQILAEVSRLRTIATDRGGPDLAQVAGLEDEVQRARLASRTAQAAAALPAALEPAP